METWCQPVKYSIKKSLQQRLACLCLKWRLNESIVFLNELQKNLLTKMNCKKDWGSLKYYRNIAMFMGVTKSHHFSIKENKMATIAKALAHPARIAILHLLAKRKTCVCGNIVDELPLSQSTVSQHLKELKDAGLITGEIEGAKVCYCIDAKGWKTAQAALNQMFETYKGGNNCC